MQNVGPSTHHLRIYSTNPRTTTIKIIVTVTQIHDITVGPSTGVGGNIVGVTVGACDDSCFKVGVKVVISFSVNNANTVK